MQQRTSTRARSAATLSWALSIAFPVLCAAQTPNPNAPPAKPPNPPTVYSNPRSGPDDPRIGLKPGLYDAGEAAFGLSKVATLPKPTGFAPGEAPTTPPPAAPAGRGGRGGEPAPNYGSVNSDLAFNGNHLFVGNYNGINFYDIDNPQKIKLRTSVVCPGGQGDVSVYGHLLFMSAEAMKGMDMKGMGAMPMMPGMLTPQQMDALSKASGAAFDHLFLTGMIQHHTGALTMVQDLFDTPGAGQDAVLFDFATDIDNTQRAEIKIMQGMLLKEKQ